jgi:hypothetical protein
VHIAFSLSQPEVETALAKIGPSMLPALTADSANGAEVHAALNGDSQAAAVPAPPPQKRVIRILGLDEGVREIPFNP